MKSNLKMGLRSELDGELNLTTMLSLRLSSVPYLVPNGATVHSGTLDGYPMSKRDPSQAEPGALRSHATVLASVAAAAPLAL